MECAKTGLKRDTTDKFYTKADIAEKCVRLFSKHILNDKPLRPHSMIIEPSAGNGAFMKELKALSLSATYYDICPENNKVQKQDFLTLSTEKFDKKTVHIIGNPPFGIQSSAAKSFIKKACSFAKSVSFILPLSFKKDTYKKTFPRAFHLIHEFVLPKNSFLVENKSHHVNCVYQIWRRSDNGELRRQPKKLLPIGFSFIGKEDNPHFSIRRTGNNAGFVDVEILKKAPNTHVFIKLDKGARIKKKIMNYLNDNLKFCKQNTVGAPSVSNQEIIKVLNPVLIKFHIYKKKKVTNS